MCGGVLKKKKLSGHRKTGEPSRLFLSRLSAFTGIYGYYCALLQVCLNGSVGGCLCQWNVNWCVSMVFNRCMGAKPHCGANRWAVWMNAHGITLMWVCTTIWCNDNVVGCWQFGCSTSLVVRSGGEAYMALHWCVYAPRYDAWQCGGVIAVEPSGV